MEEFTFAHQSELLLTLITFVILLILKYLGSKTVRKVGKISNIVEGRTRLITKYVSITLSFLGIGALAFVWGVDFRNLGLLFSSVFAVIGVALFANWSILSNITAGVILFFSFPFKIGDKIRIMDKEFEFEEHYVIEDIKAFHVHLRKHNGELITYPNNLLLQKAISLIYEDHVSSDDKDAL